MSLRTRLTLVAVGVVAIVLAIAAATTYFLMRHELYSQVDTALEIEARTVNPESLQTEAFGGFGVEFVDPNGTVFASNVPGGLPRDDAVRDVAIGRRAVFYRDIRVTHNGVTYDLREHVRPIVSPAGFIAGAIIVVRDLKETERALGRLQWILILVTLGAVLLAAVVGRIVSSATLAPVRRLTAAAERIAETGEPSERVPETGKGELGRLGVAFNTMLGSLEESLETQRRFVADASHELRTPLTSLQTNIDVLRGDIELDPQQRRELLDDLHREVGSPGTELEFAL